MSTQEQLPLDFIVPGETARYWIKPDSSREPTEIVRLSPHAVEYLADSALRASLEEQLHGDARWAVFPFAEKDGSHSHTVRVPASPLKPLSREQVAWVNAEFAKQRTAEA